MIGVQELIIAGCIILLFFGGKRIPELMRNLGRSVKFFKEGKDEVDNLKDEITNT